MLDIGMPEFLVIAIVALVVLGPERLPEVMRKAGQLYRQARETLAQYTAEAQRMFDEGMREVEDVSSTINSAWESATSADANAPPPALRQLPPPRQQPNSAADAGPWALPAWQRDGTTEREPAPPAAASPFALERLAPPDVIPGGYSSSIGGPAALPPAPVDADSAELDLAIESLPVPYIPELPKLPEVPATTPVSAGTNGTALPHTNGTTSGVHEQPVDPSREQTVIELYLQGDLAWHKAADFLGLSPEAFLDRVEQARRTTRTK